MNHFKKQILSLSASIRFLRLQLPKIFSILVATLVIPGSFIPMKNSSYLSVENLLLLDVYPEVISETLDWREGGSTGPSPRTHTAMAYDSSTGKTILFGGQSDHSTLLGDTWEWDGSQWTQLYPVNSPSARADHEMVYDSVRKIIILFAGYDLGWPADTWEWDGTNWQKKTSVTTPPGPTGFCLAYDSLRQRAVMFGGFGSDYMNETWEYDGNNWIKRTPVSSPPKRAGCAMAFDSARGKTVLFGGYNGPTIYNDLWEWDGNNWSLQSPTVSPAARRFHTLVFDPLKSEVILFGGLIDIYTMSGDIWEWDGTSWKQQQPITTIQRYGNVAAFDINRQEMVMFGGQDNQSIIYRDTWLLKSLRLQSDFDLQTVAPGSSAQYELTAVGSTIPVPLSVTNLPPGVTVQFTPGPEINPPAATTITLNTQAGMADGTYPVRVTGQANGLTTVLEISLEVIHPDFTISIDTPQKSINAGGVTSFNINVSQTSTFTDSVALSVQGLPQGTQGTFSPNLIIPGSLTGTSSRLDISSAYTTAPGTYPLTITGSGGGITHTIQASLVILPLELTVNVTPAQKTVYQDETATYAVSVTTNPVLEQPISLSVAGLDLLTHEFASPSILPGESTSLTVNTSLLSEAKTYDFSIIVSLGTYSNSAQAHLQILPASITISVAPQSKKIRWGETAIFTINTGSTPGFAGDISLSIDNAGGLITTFLSNSVSPGLTSTLQIFVPAGSKPGNQIVTVRGNNRILQVSTNLNLEIDAVTYLPFVLKQLPPGPVTLNPIQSPEIGAYVITWSEQSGRQSTGYIVDESSSSDFATSRQVCDTQEQFCYITGKLAGAYYYRVRGYNSAGQGPWSNFQQAIVLLPATPILNPIDNNDGDGSYTITWNAAVRAVNYILEESTQPDFSGAIEVYAGYGLSWNATNRANGTYYYRVLSVGPTGKSPWSNVQTATRDPNIVTFTGTGSRIVDFNNPFGRAAVQLTYVGSSNFIVWSLDANNDRIDLLVNEIGSYNGVRPMDVFSFDHTMRLQITARGSWTIRITPLAAPYVRTCQIPGTCTGHGDDLFLISGGTPDYMEFRYTGSSNIIVWSYGNGDWNRDLLVNEIGNYSGSVIIPSDTRFIDVQSSGNWSANIHTK